MGDSLVLLPGSSLQSARASKKLDPILFGKLSPPSDSFISKNEGMAKLSPMSIELSRDIERYCAAEVSFVPERFRLEARSIPDFACEVRKFVYQRTFLDNRIGQNPESYESVSLPSVSGSLRRGNPG